MQNNSANFDNPNRYVPTDNRDLARAHASALRGGVSRSTLFVSIFTFFAAICTLGWFILTNLSGPAADEDGLAPQHAAGRLDREERRKSIEQNRVAEWFYEDKWHKGHEFGEPME